MRYPASSLSEVQAKIVIAQEIYLLDHREGEGVRDAILQDVLAIAEAAHV